MYDKQSCKRMDNKLLEFLNGRAKPAERRAVEEHLTGCVECRTRAEEFRTLWNALDDVSVLSPSATFDASLRARIAAEPVHQSFWSWLPSPRLAFAVTALVAMSVWVSSMPRVTPYPSSASRISTQVASHLPGHASSQETAELSAPADFGMIRDLPVLENYDVISKFDALSELPSTPGAPYVEATKENR
jgi:anti-sigma factor RsiW